MQLWALGSQHSQQPGEDAPTQGDLSGALTVFTAILHEEGK